MINCWVLIFGARNNWCVSVGVNVDMMSVINTVEDGKFVTNYEYNCCFGTLVEMGMRVEIVIAGDKLYLM